MKKVTLKKLTLENWRAQNLIVDFSDKTIIRGANGAGKSALMEAFLWLTTHVDAQNRTNYDLFDNKKDFTPENAIPAVVEGVFDVDGTEYTLKCDAKQKWTRKRGTNVYEKAKSDEYTYYIDGLAVNAKTYNERIEAIFADIDKLKLMLNVRHYQMLDWKVLRGHFADMAGVVTKDELTGDYSSIEPLLAKYENDPTFKGRAVDAVKESLRQKINPLKNKVTQIESEIKGMKDMLPDTDGIEDAQTAIDAKRKRVEEIDREIMGLGDANKPFVEKREQEITVINAKKQELAAARIQWDSDQRMAIVAIQNQIDDIDAENRKIFAKNANIESQQKSIERQIEMAQQQAQFQSEELERLRKENAEIKARTFDENQVCQSCGQPLPFNKIAELKDAFYAKRQSDHTACVEKGLRVKENLGKQKELIESLKQSLNELPDTDPVMSKDALLNDLDVAMASVIPFTDSDVYKSMSQQIADMESALTVIPEVNSSDLVAEKKRINDEIAELSAIVAKQTEYDRGIKRISDKEKEQSKLGVELARYEGLFYKCVEREREWASIVRDRANKYLHHCKVEMTEVNKGGDLVDVCTITIDGVDVGVANTARQILAGIDIAKAFQMNAGLILPLFIDNAEQITDNNIPVVDNQMILTYVDVNYPKLTVLT